MFMLNQGVKERKQFILFGLNCELNTGLDGGKMPVHKLNLLASHTHNVCNNE